MYDLTNYETNKKMVKMVRTPPPKKKKGHTFVCQKTTMRIDNQCRNILNNLKSQAPPEAKKTDSQMIKYCIREVGITMRKRIIKKIQEHDNKADWWREQLKVYDEHSKKFMGEKK